MRYLFDIQFCIHFFTVWYISVIIPFVLDVNFLCLPLSGLLVSEMCLSCYCLIHAVQVRKGLGHSDVLSLKEQVAKRGLGLEWTLISLVPPMENTSTRFLFSFLPSHLCGWMFLQILGEIFRNFWYAHSFISPKSLTTRWNFFWKGGGDGGELQL